MPPPRSRHGSVRWSRRPRPRLDGSTRARTYTLRHAAQRRKARAWAGGAHGDHAAGARPPAQADVGGVAGGAAAPPALVGSTRRCSAADAYEWIALVKSRIWLERVRSCWFCLSSSRTMFHCWLATTCRLSSARFWLIITNVERKIASSETIIVRRPYGYPSTPKMIHEPNHRMWM